MIPSQRWDRAILGPRHREIADEWRAKGYLSNVHTVTRDDPDWSVFWICFGAVCIVGVIILLTFATA